MAQYYSAAIPPEGELLSLGEDEAHHIARVARHRAGETIKIFNGKGVQAEAEITAADSLSVTMIIRKRTDCLPAAPELTLCFASLPRTAFEEVLDQATQLGTARLQPVITAFSERNIIETWENKQPRWRQLILSAAKQCERPYMPVLLAPVPFATALKASSAPIFIADTRPGATPLHHFKELISAQGSATVFIGPEGGFSSDELIQADAAGAKPVSIAPYILRAQTACAAAAAIIMQ